jgi:hydrogenase nickel incorporation protein HypA/HybF
MALTEAVVDAVVAKMGDTRVGAVRLEIGKLSGVAVDSIRFCFDLVVEGTTLAGARLDIDEPSGQAMCRDCGAPFAVDDPIVLCPGCGSANASVLAGQELRIKSVEVSRECVPPVAARTTPECG